MKISGYKFGHPVFGLDDYYDFKPIVKTEHDFEDGNLKIYSKELDYGDNKDIIKLLEEKKAVLMAEVTCSYTMYRKCFRLDQEISITVPLQNLKNKIEVSYFVVANEQLDNYENKSIKPNLSGETFFVEEGDVIAILGGNNISLNLSTSMDSIVKFRMSKEGKNQTFYWNESSIIVNLPSPTFTKLQRIKNNAVYQNIIVYSILQSTLIHACYKLKIDGNYSEKNWHKALLILWQKHNKNSEAPSKSEIPEFVETLLQSPFILLIDSINEIADEFMNN